MKESAALPTPRRIWFNRAFEPGLPPEAFPDIVERIRGTPARLEDRLGRLPQVARVLRLQDTWSIQENAGHLLDLEPLWQRRLDDLRKGIPELSAADLENKQTHRAHHNDRPVRELLAAFRTAREATVSQLESLPPDLLLRTALHPRLKKPMSAVDLLFFVAEHDDHHLARISEILRHPKAPGQRPKAAGTEGP